LSELDQAIFNPGEAFFEDPYAVYRELRNRAPAYLDEASGLWLITRFADVERATTDYETFSSSRGNVTVDSPVRVGKTLGSMDPPRHDELRRIIQRTLAPARIATMVPAIKAETRARLDHLRDRGGSFDFVADFSRPLLFSATGKLLGLDDAAAVQSTELTAELFHHDDGPMGAVLPPTNFEEIVKFLGNQLASRQMSASDDLFSVLLEAKEAGAPLNDQEIVANLSTVLLAGNASIGHFFPNLIHALWLHPDERRKLIDDPSKILAAVEEAVRWDTSTQSFARHIMKDVEIEGVTIPADSRAVIFYASANRDERAIDDPDRFDIDRRRVKHFGFGAGAHHCAGAHASRVILKAILEEALVAFGEYELDPGTAQRVPHVMVRGFRNLPMSFGRA
jgi:cytochrome P450